MRIGAVIPCYNEGDTIEKTIMALKKLEIFDEIVVVDDGSEDDTFIKSKNMDVKCIRFDKNMGKGSAVREGLKYISSDIVVLLDGDIGNTAGEMYKVLKPVMDGQADVSIAAFPQTNKKGGFGLVKGLTRIGLKLLTGKEVRSALSGQRAYKREVLENLWIPDGYGMEFAMTAETLRLGYKIAEIEVDMTHRVTGRSLKDFLHRGRQFADIFKTLIQEILR
ncbi:MAG: glycosyltransferase family 2 protein [Thermoanaerobacteraceae bacterium]|nr:glycosyltransferase family 2 protein [Thermoanaerobacteraceae bacterium]